MRALWIDESRGMRPVSTHCPRCGLEVWEVLENSLIERNAPWAAICESCKYYFPVNAPSIAAVRLYYATRDIFGEQDSFPGGKVMSSNDR